MVKQYWVKVIGPDQIGYLLNEKDSGMSWNSIKRVREEEPLNEGGFTQFNAYEKVSKHDEMLFYIKKSKEMYSGEVFSIDWGNTGGKPIEELEGKDWACGFNFKNIKPIGKRELWKHKDEIDFLRPFKYPGHAFMTGMWRISKKDFDRIVKGW